MGRREVRQHLTVSSDPNLSPKASLLGHLFSSPHHQLRAHQPRKAVALFRRTNHYSGPLFHPRDSSRLSHPPYTGSPSFITHCAWQPDLDGTVALPIVALNSLLGTT